MPRLTGDHLGAQRLRRDRRPAAPETPQPCIVRPAARPSALFEGWGIKL